MTGYMLGIMQSRLFYFARGIQSMILYRILRASPSSCWKLVMLKDHLKHPPTGKRNK